MKISSHNLSNVMISVIIPAYNSAQYLPEAIDSVLTQTHSGCEIIVVDDGSTDGTKIVCARYLNEECSTVKYVYQDNQGLPAARNRGVEASSGKYLVFLDSDDCLLPSAIEIGLQALQEHPEAGYVFGRYLYQLARTDGTFITENTFEHQPPIASYASILADQHRTQCACVMFRREVFEAVGGYNRELWALEDIDLLLRIAQNFPIYYHQQIVSEYRIRDQNMSSKSAAMLVGAVYGHRLQRSYVEQHPEYAKAYIEGEQVWIKLFGDRILYDVIGLAQQGAWIEALGLVKLVLNYDPHTKIIDQEVYAVAGETLFAQLQQSDIQLVGAASSPDLQTLFVLETSGEAIFNPQVFDLAVINQLNEYFQQNLAGITTRSKKNTPDQQHLLERRPYQDYPQSKCIHQLFEAQVALTPQAIAVVFEEQQLTYGELNDRANQLAHYLQTTQHVGIETLVGISVERSLEMIVGLLGILKAGGAYVPLDPAYPEDRLAYILADAQVTVLLTTKDLVGSFTAYAGSLVCLDQDWPKISVAPTGNLASNLASAVTPDNLAYIIYTSGSTGKPKGVLIPHSNVGRLFEATQDWYHFDRSDVWTMFHSYAFDFSVWEIWGALIYGGKLVVVSFAVSRSPQEFYDLLQREQVTVLNQTPSAFRQLQRVATSTQDDQLSLRLVIFGGEALDLQSLTPWFAKYGDVQPQLVNMYGITETTVHVTYRPISAADLQENSGSVIGCPIPDLELYILDEELQQVAVGVAGEMYVGGAGVARGYLNRPELTAERFIQHPGLVQQKSGKLYKTGDLARYLPNGDIEYLGRIDNQVKLRGFRIELGEIEAVINQQPTVAEAVVMVREDQPGDQRLVAYVVAALPLNITELRDSLKQQLPGYMVPAAFMKIESIPLTTNGKIDRLSLPQPENIGIEPVNFVAAGNSIEANLTKIWAEVLQLEQVGVVDNFFDLGGNSLLGLRVITQIQEQFELKVSVVRLYQYSTIRSMGQYLAKAIEDVQKSPSASGSQESCNLDQSSQKLSDTGIAVIGMVGRFPGANSVDELWENLCAGKEAITFFERDEISEIVDPALLDDPNYVRAKGVLAGAELFDAGFFQISAREAEMMDPQARIFLELAHQALENAGYAVEEDNKIGVYAGSADNTYFERHLSGRSEILDRFGEFQTHLVNDRDYLPTKASYKLNLKGPSISISTACSTSLVAIIQAYHGLLNQQCDVALAGGVSIMPPQNTGYLYQEGSIFTPDGHCRPFDANAQGTSFNNGAGIVVLKRLAEAIADGDKVYAVIKGVGINNDGSDKVSFTAPSISGQVGAILQAQQTAGVDPASISYIEAHGTATPIGDPIEVEALTQAFRTKTAAKQFCGIGSIKSNLGHLTAAAGVAGFIKTVLALYHRQIPPSINFDRPNPYIDFANSPFYVNSQLRDWPAMETPRRAGVSSFGGGGTNAHVILEESLVTRPSSPSRPYQLLLLSGKTTTAIEQLTTDLRDYLLRNPDQNLADIAYTLQQGRKRFQQRRFVVCQNAPEAIANLTTLPPHLTSTRNQEHSSTDVVFMFPGQGSQYVNMGINLYRQEPVFQQAVDSCAEILQPLLEQDIRELIYAANDSDQLAQTRYTQPALFTIEYALAKLWQSWGIQPTAMVGHSIGEFVAACLAGVFSLADALKLVAARGQLMWDLPAGSMLSVRMPVAELEPRLPAEISIAAINSRSLCVVSGTTTAIEQLQQALAADEIVCKMLYTSHAFHSAMMEPIVAPFAKLVASMPLSLPQIPFVSTTTATWITNEQATDPNYWAAHLRQPVRFADAVQTLWQHNPSFVLLEVGPRQVLSTLARQQAPLPSKDLPRQIAIASQGNSSEENQDWQSLMQAIGQLWLAGITIDWQKFYAGEQRQRLPLPTYPFEKQRFWIEPLPAKTSSDFPATSIIPPQNLPSNSIMPAPSSTPEPRSIRLLPLITAVLQDTAGIEISDADYRSTFLELGLDSLSLTQVALALKKKFKVQVTFRQLLEEYSTIANLVQLIDQQLPPEAFLAATNSFEPPAITASSVLTALPIDETLSAINNLPIINPVNISSSSNIGVINQGARGAIESLVQQQLQIMARQLELLGGSGTSTSLPVTVASIPSQPAPPANADHNGNGKGNLSKPAIEQPEDPPVKAPAPGTKINRSFDHSLTAEQQAILQQIIARYVARTATSKQQAQEHRRYLADPRTVSGFTPWLKEMVYPIVTKRAKGSRLWDEDDNEYIDLTNGFGLNFFGWSPDFITDALKAQLDRGIEIGPQTALAGKVAKMITELTGMERVAFCNTGSEAVMAAFRIARTVSGRDRVVLFADSYHGTFDEVLVRGGANLKSLPAAPGLMPTAVENILVLEYGSDNALATIREYADEIAAVIVEPIQSRHPQLQPREFLQELRKITAQSEIALIFDEVVNGFRVAQGGAQEFYGIRADIATYGKVVGGGLPIGILTGSSKYMDALDGGFWQFGDDSIPEIGVTFFAGTFVRHPLALAAVEAVLTKLKAGGGELQTALANKAKYLVNELIEHFKLVGAPINVEYCSSFFYLTFPPTEAYGSLLYYLLREKGIHIWEFRPCFLTLAHSDADIEQILWAFKVCLAEMQSAGFLSGAGNAVVINQNLPPQPGAKMGKDRDGNPAWFIADPERAGKYLQVQLSQSNSIPETAAAMESSGQSDLSRSVREAESAKNIASSNYKSVDFAPFAEGEILLTAPATESQKEIWLSVQMSEQANLACLLSQSLRLQGQLNLPSLQQAFQLLIMRHESLRTTFSGDGSTILIAKSIDQSFAAIDLSGLDDQLQAQKIDQYIKQSISEPFNLQSSPLFRVDILKLSEQEHFIIFTIHHIICDGWSLGVIMSEIAELYSALNKGVEHNLDQPEHFSEYAFLEQAKIDSLEIAKTEDYWLNKFAQLPPIVDLPADYQRPLVRTFNSACENYTLSASLVEKLKQLGIKNGSSLTTVMLVAFEVFLSKLTGQTKLVVGVPTSGQTTTGKYNLVGHCVNFLPLYSNVDNNSNFSEYLRARNSSILDDYDHQEFTFGSLLQKLAVPRDASRIPLITAVFNIDLDSGSPNDFDRLKVESSLNRGAFSTFEFFLNGASTANGQIALDCQYNTNLFSGDTIQRRLSEFASLLTHIVEQENQPISHLSLLSSAAAQQLLVEWNQTQVDYPQQCIHQLFEEQVAINGAAIALVFQQEQLTYAELNQRANHLANYLLTLGVQADELIGIAIERSIETIVGILGILKAGAAYLPINLAYPPERVAFMLENADVSVLLTKQALVEKLPPHQLQILCLDTDWLKIATTSSTNPPSIAKPENLAYVMYTSGSTGLPKGVCIPHRGVVRLVKSAQYTDFDHQQVFLQLAPVSFDAATFEIWGSLLNGAKLVLFPSDKPSLAELGQVIRQQQITTLWLTAGLFHLMVDERIEDLQTLQHLIAGGDILSLPHVQKVLSTLKCRLVNGYGPTENTTFTCCHPITANSLVASVPIGRPIANTQVYILDALLQPVPIGIAGELYIGGDGLACGYLKLPELTAEKFIPNPFTGSAKLYRTGDLARYLPNGDIEFLGRIDNQVKIRGFRLELGEIEAALSQHPGLREVIVIDREDHPGDKRLVAYLVINQPPDPPTDQELRTFLRSKLPDYMIPAAFVTVDNLPLTLNGKVDRRALPIPTYQRQDVTEQAAPRDDVEIQLTAIWQRLLGVKNISIQDNFFELGGHSLIAVRLFAEIEQIWGQNLPLATLFQQQTIKQLASVLRQEEWKAPWSSLVLIQAGEAQPPLFCVHPVGGNILEYYTLAHYLGQERPIYGLQSQGLDGKQQPLQSIEDMASHYIQELQTVQPHGPYFLTGYSFGGLVAFEIAQQLQTAGEEIGMLALLDSSAPNLPSRRPSLMQSLGIHFSNLRQLTPQEQSSYISDRLAYRFSSKNEEDFLAKSLYKLEDLTPQLLNVLNCNIQAGESYTAKKYPGKMMLFRCQVQDLEHYLHPEFGWPDLVDGGVDIHPIPGPHFRMLKEPRIQFLAAELKLYLQKISMELKSLN